MHNAWAKHLVARKATVEARILSHETEEDESDFDGNVGESPLQRAEDMLYNANLAEYDKLLEIFNEKYPVLYGKYTEEAPSNTSLGEQVENLREQVTTLQTGSATFQYVEYINIDFH